MSCCGRVSKGTQQHPVIFGAAEGPPILVRATVTFADIAAGALGWVRGSDVPAMLLGGWLVAV